MTVGPLRSRVCWATAGLVVAAALALTTSPTVAGSSLVPPTIQLLDNYRRDVEPFTQEAALSRSAQTYPVANPQDTAYHCAIDFGDGSTPRGFWLAQTPRRAACASVHTYASSGTYAVTMTITDPNGVQAQSSRTISVIARPVYHRTGLIEGSSITLRVTGSPSVVNWSLATGQCRIANPTSHQATVSCSNQGVRSQDGGAFRFFFDGDSQQTSGEYDLVYVNGAPAPVMRPMRSIGGSEVDSPRVGTGDQVLWDVAAHDPSWDSFDPGNLYALPGDPLTCDFDFGDGTVQRGVAADHDACTGRHPYATAGSYGASVTVTDDSGASATTTSPVTVVRRDVRVSSDGQQAGALDARVVGTLTPAGVGGTMDLMFPDGHHVVVSSVTQLMVDDAETDLRGLATLDDDPGYLAVARIFGGGNAAMRVVVRLRGAQSPAEAVTVSQPPFTNTYRATSVG